MFQRIEIMYCDIKASETKETYGNLKAKGVSKTLQEYVYLHVCFWYYPELKYVLLPISQVDRREDLYKE